MSTLDTDTLREVVVVGSGPAGYTAAIYAARAELHPLVFESSVEAGGALMNTTDVENYPGFPTGVMGPDLMDQLRAQAERFGAELVADDIVEMRLGGDVKELVTGSGQTVRTKAVILATGSAYRNIGLDNEKRLSGRGVSWCATCDGFFFKEKDVVVVGGGDSAIEEATFLTRFARTVTIVHRRSELRASKIMQTRAFNDPKITFRWNSAVVDVLGEQSVSGVRLRDTTTGEEDDLAAHGLFVAIGHDPRTDLVRGQLELDGDGFIVVKGRTGQTSQRGVFAAGDVLDHEYMQAITAAGSGCAAALDAERYLSALDDELPEAVAAAEATLV